MKRQVTLGAMRRKLWLMGLFRIPMAGFCRPQLVSLDSDRAEIRIRLTRRTRNHLGSMYLGALATGADLASGLHAFYQAETMGAKLSFVFKGMEANFIKRAESHVHFVSEAGKEVRLLMEKAIRTGERHHLDVDVRAFNQQEELVATFTMTISVKGGV